MRLSLLLVPVALLASGVWARAQIAPETTVQVRQAPATKNDLPVVVKPNLTPGKNTALPAQQADEPVLPDADAVADPNAIPDSERGTTLDVNREKRRGRVRDDVAPSDTTAVGPDSNAGPDYTGPSILSRGMNFTRPTLPANERFRPFLGANFYHDSGVSGPYQGPAGKVTNQSFTGGDFLFGISGQHQRRFDSFQVDYRGHAYLNGISAQDHALALGYNRVLSRRISISFGETAGLYASSFAVLNSVAATDTSVANTALVVTPNTESFDDRTYYSSTQSDLTFQKNARLSFNLGASGFYVRRESRNLISANGYQTRADASYRLTKRSTVGPYYAYSRYYYSQTFGDSDIHTVGLNYSVDLSKRLQFRFRLGGTRLETRGLQTVVLAPVVAQILGYNLGIARYYAISYIPDFAADISRTFRRGELTFSYLKGVSPGNGVILTSRRDSASVNYVYSGIRRYALTFGVSRDSLGSVAQQTGNYHGYSARASISRPLPRNVQALMTFDYRRLNFSSNDYGRDQLRISVGFAFTPGFTPLKFW